MVPKGTNFRNFLVTYTQVCKISSTVLHDSCRRDSYTSSRNKSTPYFYLGFHTKIPHFFEIWPNIPIYLMFAVQISIPYQYTSFWGSGIPIYLKFSENSSNIPIYRMHDLGAQKGHTNIPHVFEKWPNIPIYLNLTSTRKLLQAHCYIGIYPT